VKNKLIFLIFLLGVSFAKPSFCTDQQREETERFFTESLSLVMIRSAILDMSSCDINDECAIRIAKALKNNPDVTQLGFQNNNIGNAGIEKLAETFQTLPNLTHLYLKDNKFDSEGAAILFLSLQNVKSLLLLDLRNIVFDVSLVMLLSDLLKENPNLKLYTSFRSFKDMFYPQVDDGNVSTRYRRTEEGFISLPKYG
jgi:hypothetical protein